MSLGSAAASSTGMLRLTLVRHARAEPGRPGQEDSHRELDLQGQREAAEIGRRLKEQNLAPDRILTSPAARALATATFLARELDIAPEQIDLDARLYLASAPLLMDLVRELGGTSPHLLLVGHNPGVSEFADGLSTERTIDSLPTAGVYTQRLPISAWRELQWASGIEGRLEAPGAGGNG